jgi:hypothetical protein
MKTAKEGEYLTATKKADFLLKSTAKPKSPGVTPTVLLRQALLSSDIRRGLISTTALTNDGLSLQFEGDQCIVYDGVGGICLQISRGGLSLYEVPYTLFSFHQLIELNLSPAEVDTTYNYSTTATRMQLDQLTLNQEPHLATVPLSLSVCTAAKCDNCLDDIPVKDLQVSHQLFEPSQAQKKADVEQVDEQQLDQLNFDQAPHLVGSYKDKDQAPPRDDTLDCLFHYSESLLVQNKVNAEQTNQRSLNSEPKLTDYDALENHVTIKTEQTTLYALETAVARSEATITTVMQGASFLKQVVFFPELLGPNHISVAELIQHDFTITYSREGEIRIYGPEQEAYMKISVDNKGYHAIPLEQFLSSYQEFSALLSDNRNENDEHPSYDHEAEQQEPLPSPPPLAKVPSSVSAPCKPMMTRSRTKAAAQTSCRDIELADVLSEAEHALLRKRRQQRTANRDQNLGRRSFKRAKPAADAFPTTGSTMSQAISIDSDSGDMSDQESDHIDDSGTSSSHTWTQPSSPKPSLASPLPSPIASAPIEPILLSPDYFAPYNESYDSDYGAGLSSASDHDDPNMESQVTVEKQNSAMESHNELNTTVEKQNSSYRRCSPLHCSQIIDLTNDDSDRDFIKRTQARRTQVDGQSATHNDDDSDSDVTVLQARRTQVHGQSATFNDDDANVSSAEDDYDSEAEEANDEMEALIAIRDFLRETAALRRNEAPTT